MNPTYERWYQPECDLSLDESMVKFKGRLAFRQYLPAKPTRWGIKQFVLAEAKSGYCLKSVVYSGKTSFARLAGVSLSEQVVLSLLEGYENKGHIVHLDNFYSAPILFIDKAVKSRGGEGGYRTVEKPVIAERYNSKMGGVDCLDQMLGTYQYPHKCLKWYHTLYHRVREIALVNGFILYKKANPTKRVTPKKFREEVISGLLKTWNPPQRKTGRPSNTEDPLRLTGRHFLGKNENPKQKLDCRVCSDRKNKKRVQTVFYCKQCNIPMCCVPCFERYHTLRHYDR